MANTNFVMSVSLDAGPITIVTVRNSNNLYSIYPYRDPVRLLNQVERLKIEGMSTSPSSLSGLDHLLVTVETHAPNGSIIGRNSWVASDDPYIDLSSVPNATRYVTFSLYIPVVVTTHYQLYCSDDVSRFTVNAGGTVRTCYAANSPLVFDFDGNVSIVNVYGPSGELCASNKVDISSDGSTWLLSRSSTIPEKPNGTKSAFVRYFGIDYNAEFRTMQDDFRFSVYVDGVRRANVGSSAVPVNIVIHANENVVLKAFSHPEGYGRPWKVYVDSDGSWQDTSAETTGGEYKLWFASRRRRVQVSATDKASMMFYWWSEFYDPVKIAPKKFFSVNMMATVWNRFCQKIYDTYRLWDRYPGGSMPTVSSGATLTAAIFNSARSFVSNLPGAGPVPPAAAKNEAVKASYFEGPESLKDALNTAILHYMDSDS